MQPQQTHGTADRRPPETSGHTATFRFYAELNDFLPPESAGQERTYRFAGQPSVKDAIEAQGVPHTEVDLILANQVSVGFEYHVCDGDRIAVYPVFELFDISPVSRLRQAPLRDVRFVLDVHLGKLARWLRLVGFDAVYRNDFADSDIAALAAKDSRVVLTCDRGLLHRKEITHGYWVRAREPDAQIVEVLRRFQLERRVRPFERCLACNGRIHPVATADVLEELEPKTRKFYHVFRRCEGCGKVYWQGSHYERMVTKLQRVLSGSQIDEGGITHKS